MATEDAAEAGKPFARALRALFERVPAKAPGADGRQRLMTNADVAQALQELGINVSPAYIGHLRTGRKSNPRGEIVAGLARVFDVDYRYFYDEDYARHLILELDALRLERSAREMGVEGVLSRSQGEDEVTRLSPQRVRDLQLLLDFLRYRDSQEESGHDGGRGSL